MKIKPLVFALFYALSLSIAHAEMNMEWAYHDDSDGIEHRATEKVPGETFSFLANGSTSVSQADTVILYVLTANQFAGEGEEQVYLRWWNGQEEHWIQGQWEKNIWLGEGEKGIGGFHGFPRWGEVMVDLWKFEVPSEITKAGDNFYTIQLKHWSDAGAEERYLLRESAGDFGGKNDLGQAWTASSEGFFGKDWKVSVTE